MECLWQWVQQEVSILWSGIGMHGMRVLNQSKRGMNLKARV